LTVDRRRWIKEQEQNENPKLQARAAHGGKNEVFGASCRPLNQTRSRRTNEKIQTGAGEKLSEEHESDENRGWATEMKRKTKNRSEEKTASGEDRTDQGIQTGAGEKLSEEHESDENRGWATEMKRKTKNRSEEKTASGEDRTDQGSDRRLERTRKTKISELRPAHTR
jgi:hypothetical protein